MGEKRIQFLELGRFDIKFRLFVGEFWIKFYNYFESWFFQLLNGDFFRVVGDSEWGNGVINVWDINYKRY